MGQVRGSNCPSHARKGRLPVPLLGITIPSAILSTSESSPPGSLPGLPRGLVVRLGRNMCVPQSPLLAWLESDSASPGTCSWPSTGTSTSSGKLIQDGRQAKRVRTQEGARPRSFMHTSPLLLVSDRGRRAQLTAHDGNPPKRRKGSGFRVL